MWWLWLKLGGFLIAMSLLVPPQVMSVMTAKGLRSVCILLRRSAALDNRCSLPLRKGWLPGSTLSGLPPTSLAVPFSGVPCWCLCSPLRLPTGERTPGLPLGPLPVYLKAPPRWSQPGSGNCCSFQTGFPASALAPTWWRWRSSQGIPVKIGVRSRHSLARIPSRKS